MPASRPLPPPQNAAAAADGETMAVYKAKVSSIMSEMMARMRRDAQERDAIAEAANSWRHKHDELLGRHEAAGRRLVRVMDALRDSQQNRLHVWYTVVLFEGGCQKLALLLSTNL